MSNIPLYLELPANLSAKKFFSRLGKNLNVQIIEQCYSLKTFYDSFDWRLFNAKMIAEFNQSKSSSQFSLIHRKQGYYLASEKMDAVPRFAGQFPEGEVKNLITKPLEMRALLPLCQLPHQLYWISILNDDEKTVLRLKLEEFETLPHKLTLYPLKGYDKAARKVDTLLEKAFKLKPVDNAATFYVALAQQGRKPGDYQSGLNIKLNPEQSVEEVCQLIFKHLLKNLKANEAGTIEDIDSEFLHDFRVAVRRTRAAFSVFKKVLPEAIVQQYAPFFAWLGQVTGPTRDLDVYLLNYENYKQVLPPTLHDELTPFYHFLKTKQKQAQQKMAAELQSDRYKQQIVAWEEFLNAAKLFKTKKTGTIKYLADQRIWKMYKRLLKEGECIDDESPAESLHELRKTSKKLRYLMEFFQTLYPEDKIKPCIRALKDFQSVLGDFQDYDVQEVSIKQFSDEMLTEGADSNTILAMGVLIQYLDTLKVAARQDFDHQFACFKRPENHKHFQKLFAGKGSGDKA